MKVQSFRELTVWQKSMNLAKDVYVLTKQLPKDELYGLSSQMRRAAVSVSSNIAEGQQRRNTKEFIQFIGIAKGSLAELETQLTLTVSLYEVKQSDFSRIMSLIAEVQKMLFGLSSALLAKN